MSFHARFPPDTLSDILTYPGNGKCCDCGSLDTNWASINHGTLICLECAGQHRALGVQISFIRSIQMDSWSEQQVELMKQGGNEQIRRFFRKLQCDNLPIRTLYCTKGAGHYRKKLKERVEKIQRGELSGIRRRMHRPVQVGDQTSAGNIVGGDICIDIDRSKGSYSGSRRNKKPITRQVPLEKASEYSISFGDGPMGMTVTKHHHDRAIVSRVLPDGAAQTNGVQVGDYIVGVSGIEIELYADIMRLISTFSRPIEIVFLREARTPSYSSSKSDTALSSLAVDTCAESPVPGIEMSGSVVNERALAGGGVDGVNVCGQGSSTMVSSANEQSTAEEREQEDDDVCWNESILRNSSRSFQKHSTSGIQASSMGDLSSMHRIIEARTVISRSPDRHSKSNSGYVAAEAEAPALLRIVRPETIGREISKEGFCESKAGKQRSTDMDTDVIKNAKKEIVDESWVSGDVEEDREGGQQEGGEAESQSTNSSSHSEDQSTCTFLDFQYTPGPDEAREQFFPSSDSTPMPESSKELEWNRGLGIAALNSLSKEDLNLFSGGTGCKPSSTLGDFTQAPSAVCGNLDVEGSAGVTDSSLTPTEFEPHELNFASRVADKVANIESAAVREIAAGLDLTRLEGVSSSGPEEHSPSTAGAVSPTAAPTIKVGTLVKVLAASKRWIVGSVIAVHSPSLSPSSSLFPSANVVSDCKCDVQFRDGSVSCGLDSSCLVIAHSAQLIPRVPRRESPSIMSTSAPASATGNLSSSASYSLAGSKETSETSAMNHSVLKSEDSS